MLMSLFSAKYTNGVYKQKDKTIHGTNAHFYDQICLAATDNTNITQVYIYIASRCIQRMTVNHHNVCIAVRVHVIT